MALSRTVVDVIIEQIVHKGTSECPGTRSGDYTDSHATDRDTQHEKMKQRTDRAKSRKCCKMKYDLSQTDSCRVKVNRFGPTIMVINTDSSSVLLLVKQNKP